MVRIKGLIMFLKQNKIFLQNFRKYVSSATFRFNPYILSAARTPIGLKKGSLTEFTAPQLCSFVLKEALQRAAVPYEDLKHVFLGCLLYNSSGREIIKRTGLPKVTKVSSVSASSIKSFIEAVNFLYTNNKSICIAAGMESVSNLPFPEAHAFQEKLKMRQKDVKNILKDTYLDTEMMNRYLLQDHKNYLFAKSNGAFLDEIIKIDFKKKGNKVHVFEDEASEQNVIASDKSELMQGPSLYTPVLCDGAAAIVISTENYIKSNNLTPLAKIISFVEEPVNWTYLPGSLLSVVNKALQEAKCEPEKIARWEIDSTLNDIVLACINHFKINPSLVNKDGSVLSLGYPIGMSGVRALCHLTHSLSPEELGFCISYDFKDTVSAVVIKKFYRGISAGVKPQLILYTKKSCTLCEEMKHQLQPYEGRISLEEIDIEEDDNKRFKELYKYDVPILFFDGRFLNKQNIDIKHFLRRLAEYENSRTPGIREGEEGFRMLCYKFLPLQKI